MSWLGAVDIKSRYPIPQRFRAGGIGGEWLQDINWPGALEVKDILKSMDIKEILPSLENALKKSASEEDYIWIANIKELVNELGITSEQFK